MSTQFRIAVTLLCGLLLGLPAAQAQDQPSTKRLRIEIGLVDHDFSAHPENLTLKAGEFYRLELVNWSQGIRHVVMAPEFAGAVVTSEIRQLLPQRENMPGASFGNGIDLPPGGRVEIFFVPYKEGRYKLFCQDRVHTDAGVDVAVEVRL